MKRLAVLGVLAIAAPSCIAAAQSPQPYAGFETRPIKALSGEQIADLRAGRGMGLALAAELNGYPGPVHVIELAQPLGLSDAQRAKVQSLFDAMKAETVPLGQKLIAQEADLDRQFANKTITEPALAAFIQAIAGTQAALRTAHLKYHLATLDVLTPAQTKQYAELRGYAGGHAQHQHVGHKH
jgi:Spy/CpxP family protein refolding chaperone